MIESEYTSLNTNNPTTLIEDDQKEQIQIHDSFELEEHFKPQSSLYWGKCKPFVFKNNKPNIVIGPHWPFFLVAYCVFLGLSIAMIIYAFMTLTFWLVGCTTLVCFAQLWAYAQVFLRNPGVANVETVYVEPSLRGERRKRNENWFCGVCNLSQCPTTVHCADCQVCIFEMDHHCPWTSKCVGKGNLRDFYLFLFTTVVFLVFNLIVSMSVSLQRANQQQ